MKGDCIRLWNDLITICFNSSSDYGVAFFKKFSVVFNALDNRAARSHVNRMCLAADVPLVSQQFLFTDMSAFLIIKNFLFLFCVGRKQH